MDGPIFMECSVHGMILACVRMLYLCVIELGLDRS